MPTRGLYSVWDLAGYRVLGLSYSAGAVHVQVEDRCALACPKCGSQAVIRSGKVARRWRSVPIGLHRVWVQMAVPRVACRGCREVRQISVRFAEPGLSYTHAFAGYALRLLGVMTIQDAAGLLGVGWDLLKDLQKSYLRRHYADPPLEKVRRIAVDEICIGRPRRFWVLALDLDQGRVVYVAPGRGYGCLAPFGAKLRRAGARVRAVALDMARGLNAAVQTFGYQVAFIWDRFHVIKRFNDLLTGLRSALYRQATDQLQRQVLKGSRWLLLKSGAALDDQLGERRRLAEALELNQPLATAYYLKEELSLFWRQSGKRAAQQFLTGWVQRAESSGLWPVRRFARNLLLHRHRLLAWYDYPISTAPLEGTNNKIKLMQRQAYGYRDLEFFRLKILALHQAKIVIVG